MVVLGILIAIIACVVRRRTKETINPPESAEVRHSLMPSLPTDATSLPYSKSSEPASYSKSSNLAGGGFSSKTSELPPPPPPSQWSHLYSASCTSSSHYEGPTYEVNTEPLVKKFPKLYLIRYLIPTEARPQHQASDTATLGAMLRTGLT